VRADRVASGPSGPADGPLAKPRAEVVDSHSGSGFTAFRSQAARSARARCRWRRAPCRSPSARARFATCRSLACPQIRLPAGGLPGFRIRESSDELAENGMRTIARHKRVVFLTRGSLRRVDLTQGGSKGRATLRRATQVSRRTPSARVLLNEEAVWADAAHPYGRELPELASHYGRGWLRWRRLSSPSGSRARTPSSRRSSHDPPIDLAPVPWQGSP